MTFAGLVVFRTWFPNPKEAGPKTTGGTPEPLNCAAWGLFAALSLKVSVPVRAPTVVGVNMTEIVQLALAANVFGARGQFELVVKSPETAMPVMVKGTV
jgi:hypothetical protein